MTQNKFWLVWSPQGLKPPKKRYETQEKAIDGAKKLAESYPKQNVFVMQATHHFKADVSVVETDLTAPENDFVEFANQTTQEKPKFKVGDKVRHPTCGIGIIKSINQMAVLVDFGIPDYGTVLITALTHA